MFNFKSFAPNKSCVVCLQEVGKRPTKNSNGGLPELGGLIEHPLQTLARAARAMNPKQFDLPKSLIPHIQLPGIIYRSSQQINAP